MNLQGDFEGLTLASIFQLLCNDQKTGILTVCYEDEQSRIFFEQGTIVYASASLKEAQLGYLMRNDGIVSVAQLQKCFALAKEKKVHFGKILVEKGYISFETLKKYNTRQVETILYNLLFWKKGRFGYRDAKLNLKGMVVTKLSPMKLILEASRKIDELSVIKNFIPTDQLVFQMSRGIHNKKDIRINVYELRILSLIDGTRTVRQVISESGYDDFDVYKIFFSAISSGIIEQAETQPEAQPVRSTGNIKRIIDTIISQRSRGNPAIAKSMKAKFALKGINPDNYTADTPDDPVILKRLTGLAKIIGINVSQSVSSAGPVRSTGNIKRIIDTIISQRSGGNPAIAKSMKAKFALKGINPDKYTADTPDDPLILKRLKLLAQAMGISLSAGSSHPPGDPPPGNVRRFIDSFASQRSSDTPTPSIAWSMQTR